MTARIAAAAPPSPVCRIHSTSVSAVVLAGVASFVVNLLGAVQGAMCCPDGRNAFRNHLATLGRGDVPSFPLAAWLIVPLAVCVVLFVVAVVGRRKLPHAVEID